MTGSAALKTTESQCGACLKWTSRHREALCDPLSKERPNWPVPMTLSHFEFAATPQNKASHHREESLIFVQSLVTESTQLSVACFNLIWHSECHLRHTRSMLASPLRTCGCSLKSYPFSRWTTPLLHLSLTAFARGTAASVLDDRGNSANKQCG